jgi:hypothetical protein
MAEQKVQLKVPATITIDGKRGTFFMEFGDVPAIPISKTKSIKINLPTEPQPLPPEALS